MHCAYLSTSDHAPRVAEMIRRKSKFPETSRPDAQLWQRICGHEEQPGLLSLKGRTCSLLRIREIRKVEKASWAPGPSPKARMRKGPDESPGSDSTLLSHEVDSRVDLPTALLSPGHTAQEQNPAVHPPVPEWVTVLTQACLAGYAARQYHTPLVTWASE